VCVVSTSAQSTITNKSRLKLLHKREEILQQIFATLREPPTSLCEMGSKYDDFLEGVIVEGFLHVMEPTVAIHCRKSDVKNVNTAAIKASKTYQDLSGMGITFEVLGSIADDWYAMVLKVSYGDTKYSFCRSQGGVKIVSGSGRISLNNTFEERLRLLEEKVSFAHMTASFANPTLDAPRNPLRTIWSKYQPQILYIITEALRFSHT